MSYADDVMEALVTAVESGELDPLALVSPSATQVIEGYALIAGAGDGGFAVLGACVGTVSARIVAGGLASCSECGAPLVPSPVPVANGPAWQAVRGQACTSAGGHIPQDPARRAVRSLTSAHVAAIGYAIAREVRDGAAWDEIRDLSLAELCAANQDALIGDAWEYGHATDRAVVVAYDELLGTRRASELPEVVNLTVTIALTADQATEVAGGLGIGAVNDLAGELAAWARLTLEGTALLDSDAGGPQVTVRHD